MSLRRNLLSAYCQNDQSREFFNILHNLPVNADLGFEDKDRCAVREPSSLRATCSRNLLTSHLCRNVPFGRTEPVGR